MSIIFSHVKKHSAKLTCFSRFVVFNNYSITRIINNDDNDDIIKVTDLKEEITKVAPITSAYGVKKPKPRRKIMKLGLNRPIIKAQIERNKKLEEDAMISQLPWRIMGSTYPVITTDIPEWEQDMMDLQDRNQERRLKHFYDLVGGTDAQFIPDTYPANYEEIIESMPFKPASRITEADNTNDRRSTERRLQDSLYLIVKRNRTFNPWQFPQGKIQSEENLREATERVIDRAVGKINRWFIGNAPCGHYFYSYPEEIQNSRKNFGSKLFFYRTQLIHGTIKLNTKLYTDYAWIARDEVGEYFDKETAEYMSHLLPY